jgi:phosphatidylinositol alpha-1,6-mannosyltransferase
MGYLLLALDYPPAVGGIQRYCYELTAALARRGVKIAVIASQQPHAAEFDAAQPFPTVRVPAASKAGAATGLVAAAERALEENLLGEPVQAVICGKWFPEGGTCLLLKRRRRLPYVLLAYGREITLTGGNLMKWLMQRQVARGAAGALVISDYTGRQVAQRGVPPARIAKILAGVNPEELVVDPEQVAQGREWLGLKEGEKVLLTVGRLVWRKGHAQVLKALPEVARRVGPLRYVIAGSGPEYETLARQEFGEDFQVTLLGNLPDSGLPSLYALADVFVMPSRDLPGEPIEGFGLVYLEANLCGTPAIGGNTGGTADAILDGETGLLVNPEKPEEIAEALVKLLSDPDLARRLAEAGKARIERELTWGHVAERTMKALGEWGLGSVAQAFQPVRDAGGETVKRTG